MPSKIIQNLKERTDKTISHYKEELKGIRTGRASVSMFDNIKVDYYGTPTPLAGVATLSSPEPRLVTVTPWEPSLIKEIEKAIRTSQMSFNPSNDGKVIRIPFPQLTEDRRKELVKIIKKISEDTKIAIRNERRDSNEKLKKAEKDKLIGEDECKKMLDDTQKLTDVAIKNVDDITASKEKEVMEI